MKENHETRPRISWRSLTFQLLAIVVFPLIALLLVITFGSTTLHQNAMRELVGERDKRAAQMASTAIEDQILRRVNEVRGLAAQVSDDSGTRPDEVFQNAAYLMPDFDAGLAVIGRDGQVISAQGNPEMWPGQKDLLSAGLDALGKDLSLPVYFSEPVTRSGQEQRFMVVIVPAANRQVFVAGAFYTSPMIEHVFNNVFSTDQAASVVVITPDGSILYRKGFDSSDELVSRHAGISEAFAGKTGTTHINMQDGEHVVAYSPVAPQGWALLIEEPWNQVSSPILQTTHMAPLVMVPVLLLALLALFFGVRQIVQPLQALATQSGKLGWGDYSAIEKPVGGVSEIRQLQHELIHMAHKLGAAQQSLHSYIGAITSGQEEERRRLARELHDDTIQSLIAFKQRIQLVEMDWEGHPVATALSDLENVVEQTIDNLRRMVSALRPIYLEDLGLVAAVNMLANDAGEKLNAPVDFSRHGKERRLDAPVELALYRIVQEALSNITRHSGATQASIRLAFQPDAIRIEIQDNGKGFSVPRSPSEFAPKGHFGLLGMFERADLMRGSIQIDSAAGHGTRLIVTVPASTAENIKVSATAIAGTASL